ncbi:MAG: hypothetical protein D8M58_14435 [Calditrichaeota bacterium]|nr:MAG: hypothetical protein DWQ03_15675 [Calditrichota bacterium]MBL1206599.1 hypothetical protein [Calditrichota bacterium]NOG46426.1 hypothetical protein [Calditrichota bacterium]
MNRKEELFLEKIEFIGNINDERIFVDNLQFEVYYSLLNRSKITGKIFGTNENYKTLINLINSSASYLNLIAEFDDEIISSSKLSLRGISGKDTSRDPKDRMNFEIGRFELLDLKIVHSFNSESKKRIITYFLDGPHDVWNVRKTIEKNDSGEYYDHFQKLYFDIDNDFLIYITQRVFSESDNTDTSNFDISTNKYILTVETELPIEILSDDCFIEKSKSICDDLLLLSSYLSKSWIDWYGYYLSSSNSIVKFFQKSRDVEHKTIYPDKFPINIYKNKKFFDKSIKSLNDSNFDIRMALTYFIASQKSKHVEEQFTTLFLSLEKLKDSFALQRKLSKNLSDKDFKKLRSKISALIETEIVENDILDEIKIKLPELNRPSVKTVLFNLFSELDITWKDIYPKDSDFTLIKTRDTLFHSSSKIEIDIIISEVIRLEILLDRIILKLLGWNDLSQVKKEYHNSWLLH